MKKVLIILGALAAVTVLVVVLLIANLGAVIQAAVERIGSEATGAKVTLASADVSLTSGEGSLKGLVIGNPEGFHAPTAFELDLVSLKIDPASVGKDVIVIREVTIDGPRVTYELNERGATNLGTIQDNVQKYGAGAKSGGKAGGGGKAPAAEPGDPEAPQRFIVETFRIRGGRVRLATAVAGDKKADAEIPDVEVRDLGKAKGGATGEELAAEAIEILTRKSLEAAARSELERQAKKLLDGLGEKARGLLDGVLGKDKKK